jgi:8-oxo-dGTP pyrophosphatase MutT (NUDIX family)
MKLYQEFLMGQDDNVKREVNVSGAVILKTNNEGTKSVLLIQRAHDDNWPDVWEFPRGKCDKGDKHKLLDCVKREVKEEVGLDIDTLEYIDKYEYLADGGTRKSVQFNYLCKMKDPTQKVKLSKEHQNFRWTQSVGEVELLVPPEMKKTIMKVLNIDEKLVNPSKKFSKQVIEETQKRWKK